MHSIPLVFIPWLEYSCQLKVNESQWQVQLVSRWNPFSSSLFPIAKNLRQLVFLCIVNYLPFLKHEKGSFHIEDVPNYISRTFFLLDPKSWEHCFPLVFIRVSTMTSMQYMVYTALRMNNCLKFIYGYISWSRNPLLHMPSSFHDHWWNRVITRFWPFHKYGRKGGAQKMIAAKWQDH